MRLRSVPGFCGNLRILLRLMSRISIEGMSHSCRRERISKARTVKGGREREHGTHHSGERREEVDADVEVLEAGPELDKVRRQVLDEVVPERELLDLVAQLVDDLERQVGDALVAQVDRVELGPAAGAVRRDRAGACGAAVLGGASRR